jgi:hypothetical protein
VIPLLYPRHRVPRLEMSASALAIVRVDSQGETLDDWKQLAHGLTLAFLGSPASGGLTVSGPAIGARPSDVSRSLLWDGCASEALVAHPPHNFRDLTGQRFEAHRLTVVERIGVNKHKQVVWRCRKDNGKEVLRTASYLNAYAPKRKPRVTPKRKPKTSTSKPPEYAAWASMRARCTNANIAGFKDYGGRGISVCERWRESYNLFLQDMGPRPSTAHSLDRIDVNGDYEPSNCRWATTTEQARNRQGTIYLEHDGLRLSLPDWADRLGVPPGRLYNRVKQGLTISDVLSPKRRKAPKRPRRPRKSRHGRSGTREFRAWAQMVRRCTDPRHAHWNHYGARGINVCPLWVDSFERYIEDLGPCPPEHQLGRIDTSQGYSASNCRWMTRTEAMRTSKGARILEHRGTSLSMTDWSERTGIPAETIRGRLRMGWTVGESLGID